MSASTHAAQPAKAATPLRPLPAAALGSALLSVIVISLGGPPAVARAALAIGGACIVGEWLWRLSVAVRAGRATALAVAALALAVAVGAAVVIGEALTLTYAWVALFAEAGAVLLYAAARAGTSDTPWQSLTRRGLLARRETALALAGLVALLVAAYLALEGWAELRTYRPVRSVTVAVLVAAGFAAASVVLFLRALRPVPAADSRRHADEIAAHLHDSVLQTLALIGRNADDPAQVALLARQQERSLRAWLAGRDEPSADSLAGALRLAAQEVEDEQPGARIEVVVVGDTPLDPGADAMLRAAREAMRNAARHAGSPVRVFLEVDGGVRELFIRDTGTGFDLDAVPDERRGVRDAIIGRMEHAGGTATIEAGSSGTEIALRHEARGADEGAA